MGCALKHLVPTDKAPVPIRLDLGATTLLKMLKTLLMVLKTLKMVLKPLWMMEISMVLDSPNLVLTLPALVTFPKAMDIFIFC